MRFLIVALGVTVAFAGCGGDGGATTACTLGTGPTRVCLEIWTNFPASGGPAQAAADCTNGGGVASTTCTRAGADGGCRTSISAGGVTETATQWFYTGSPAQEMARCAMNQGSTWISP